MTSSGKEDEEIRPALADAVLKLERLGEARHWDTFAMTGKRCRYNAMRHLKRRGWIEDAAEDERRAYSDAYSEGDEVPWIAVPSRWRLTKSGREAAKAIRRQRKRLEIMDHEL